MPEVLALIEDRDTWRLKDPRSKAIHSYLLSMPRVFPKWNDIIINTTVDLMYEAGKYILFARDAYVLRMLRRWELNPGYTRLWDDGPFAPIINVEREMASDMLHALWLEHAMGNHPCTVGYEIYADRTEYHLRSGSEGMDVNKIAQRYGGGGHKHAAGFARNLSTFEVWPEHEMQRAVNREHGNWADG